MAFIISRPSVYFLAMYCETMLHGMYTVLFCTTMYLLVFKRPRTSVNIWFIGMTVVMYGLATSHSAICLHEAFARFHVSQDGVVVLKGNASLSLEYIKLALEVINCLLGDTIVLWRAWTLWRKNFIVCLMPLLFFMGSIATGVGMVYDCSRMMHDGAAILHDRCGRWAISWAAMSLATNAAVTVIVTYNSWLYHCDVRRILGRSASPLHLHVSLLLIESGAFYCCTFASLLVLFILRVDGAYVLNHMIPQLTGIYPTLIVVLICLKLTRSDMTSRHSKPVLFSPRRQTITFAASTQSETALESRMEIAISTETEYKRENDIKPTPDTFPQDAF